MFVRCLTCFACGNSYPKDVLINLCECGKPLRVDYDLEQVGKALKRSGSASRGHDLWRYRELLPLPKGVEPDSLGEGGTPLLSADALAQRLGLPAGTLWVKDEALNPTGSFKARGMAVAVPMAKHLGAKKLAVPSAGNAGGAMSAYAARAGLEAHVFLPRDVPVANRIECEIFGARVTLVDGLINECARMVQERKEAEGWFDVSTLKEPFRVEGKKTMGYEIAEQLGWVLPDVILYPTGGGTGLIGMDKAFEEMEALEWIGPKRPRMVSVQAEGCAPIVRAFDQGLHEAPPIEHATTIAAGLRVPGAIGDFIMLDILRKTGGCAVAVPDRELIAAASEMGATTGVCASPEGGASLAALRRLVATGWVKPGERIVLFNTGSGTKSIEALAGAMA